MMSDEQPNLKNENPERRKDGFADEADVEGHMAYGNEPGFATEGEPGLASGAADFKLKEQDADTEQF